MNPDNDLYLQFQMIKATFRDHQKTVPFPASIMFGWALISMVLIFGTPLILSSGSDTTGTITALYMGAFIVGIGAEYRLFCSANDRAGISLSPTQKYILKTHAVGGIFGLLMTLMFVQYSIIEMLYVFWTFWIGLAVFITGFLTKEFIQKIGTLMMGAGIAGLIGVIVLKGYEFSPLSRELYFNVTMGISFVMITLTHLWMGFALSKDDHA